MQVSQPLPDTLQASWQTHRLGKRQAQRLHVRTGFEILLDHSNSPDRRDQISGPSDAAWLVGSLHSNAVLISVPPVSLMHADMRKRPSRSALRAVSFSLRFAKEDRHPLSDSMRLSRGPNGGPECCSVVPAGTRLPDTAIGSHRVGRVGQGIFSCSRRRGRLGSSLSCIGDETATSSKGVSPRRASNPLESLNPVQSQEYFLLY